MAESKAPSFPLAKIAALRDKLELGLNLSDRYVGSVLEGDLFQEYVHRVSSLLLSSDVEEDVPDSLGVETPQPRRAERVHGALENTLSVFAGKEFTPEVSRKIAALIAGNAGQLREGVAVMPSVDALRPGWRPFEIAEVRLADRVTASGVVLTEMHLLTLAGPSVGLTITQIVPKTFLSRFAVLIGLSRFKKYHWRELTRMWFVGRLEADTHDKTRLKLVEQHTQSSMMTHNRKLYKSRGEKCLRNFAIMCHKCPVGYDRCVRGTHKETYVRAECERGHMGYFRPKEKSQLCLSCREHSILARR